MKSSKNLFAAAEAAWPEDEASLTFEAHQRATENEDAAYAVTVSAKNIARMHKVFERETDGAALIARYDAEMRRLGMPAEAFGMDLRFSTAIPPYRAAHGSISAEYQLVHGFEIVADCGITANLFTRTMFSSRLPQSEREAFLARARREYNESPLVQQANASKQVFVAVEGER